MAIQIYVVSKLSPFIIFFPGKVVKKEELNVRDSIYITRTVISNDLEIETTEDRITIYHNDTSKLVSEVKHVEDEQAIDRLFKKFNINIQYINQDEEEYNE